MNISVLNWNTGSGKRISLQEIMKNIESHIKDQGVVFVGTDSMLRPDQCVFATAICLYGAKGQVGGKYFFKRNTEKDIDYFNLNLRLIREVEKSIKIAGEIIKEFPDVKIEIHIDVGSDLRCKSRGLVDMLKGWASSAGFSCKIKPEAWASASVADKHTK